jgi:hypothetical protein
MHTCIIVEKEFIFQVIEEWRVILEMKEGYGKIYKRRSDGKYFVYIPLYVATDSAFPFRDWELSKHGTESIKVHVIFEDNPARLIITKKEKEVLT